MKKLLFSLLAIPMFFSCEKETETTIYHSKKVFYTIKSFDLIFNDPMDLNNDGIGSTNIMEELEAGHYFTNPRTPDCEIIQPIYQGEFSPILNVTLPKSYTESQPTHNGTIEKREYSHRLNHNGDLSYREEFSDGTRLLSLTKLSPTEFSLTILKPVFNYLTNQTEYRIFTIVFKEHTEE
ncbi:hypothetical protein AB4865_02800 [Capnocytophaga sp. ARDL2]|uniref:hypothetical protein n=1 Tax=Capnocytophaga sp. ARDL2 TaxID=3238809 RepID=UPI0035584E5E